MRKDSRTRLENVLERIQAPRNEQACGFCSRFDRSTQEYAPSACPNLQLLVGAGACDALYACDHCGQLWEYHAWTETPDWGQCMEGRTEPYEESCLYKRSASEAFTWLERMESGERALLEWPQ